MADNVVDDELYPVTSLPWWWVCPRPAKGWRNNSLSENLSSLERSSIDIFFHVLDYVCSGIKEMCYAMTEQSEEVGQQDLDWI